MLHQDTRDLRVTDLVESKVTTGRVPESPTELLSLFIVNAYGAQIVRSQ